MRELHLWLKRNFKLNTSNSMMLNQLNVATWSLIDSVCDLPHVHVCVVVCVGENQTALRERATRWLQSKISLPTVVNWQVELNERMCTQQTGPDYEITQNQITEVAIFVRLECGVKWQKVPKEKQSSSSSSSFLRSNLHRPNTLTWGYNCGL